MRALGFPVKKAEVKRLIAAVDARGFGRVELSDFIDIMAEKVSELDPLEEIKRAFHLFDEEGTGRISVRNLRRICKELGESISEDELTAMVDEFDRNQDGEIDLEEFLYIMSQESLAH
jgi:centrin-3